jgi:hypothetical protein
MYSHLLDGWGTPCCNNTDCRPARFRITPRGVEMFVDRNWIRIPPDKLQYRILHGDSGETGGGHWCGSSDWGFDGPSPTGTEIQGVQFVPNTTATVMATVRILMRIITPGALRFAIATL